MSPGRGLLSKPFSRMLFTLLYRKAPRVSALKQAAFNLWLSNCSASFIKPKQDRNACSGCFLLFISSVTKSRTEAPWRRAQLSNLSGVHST